MGDDPATRFRENATEIATTLVTGIWLAGLLLGASWWLPALLFGYIVVVPIVALLFGDEADRREWWDGWEEGGAASESDRPSDESVSTETGPGPGRDPESKRDALETLRSRYARGELTDAQFERKLELLLETDTLENASEWATERRHGARVRERNEDDRDPDVEFDS